MNSEKVFVKNPISISLRHNVCYNQFQYFDALPSWQKHGIGIYWADVEKTGYNPITKQTTIAKRRGLKVDYELPLGDAYGKMLRSFL